MGHTDSIIFGRPESIMYTCVTSTVASVCMIRDGCALFLENEQGGGKCDPKFKLASHVVGPTPPQDHWMPRGQLLDYAANDDLIIPYKLHIQVIRWTPH